MKFDMKLGKVAPVLFLALAMAGCGGGGSSTAGPVEPPPPAPIDVERMAISDAIAAASAAAQMVTDSSTDAEVAAADMAVAAAMQAIADATLVSAGDLAMSRTSLTTIQGQLATAKASRTMVMTLASQRMAISYAIAATTTAVGAVMDGSDDATVTAAEDAIAAASAAIAVAGGILASEAAAARAEVAALQTALNNAKSRRQMAMDDADAMEAQRTAQLAAIDMAIEAATTAVGMVNDESTQQQVDAASAAVATATDAIAEAADVSDDVKATHTASVSALATTLTNAVASRNTAMAAEELANQRMAISDAIAAAMAAVGAVMDDSDDATVTAADNAIKAAEDAIEAATDVSDEELAANTGTVDAFETTLANAKMSRMDAVEARALAQAKANQRNAISIAIAAAKTAVAAVTDDATEEQVMAADDAITAAMEAIAAGTDLPPEETAPDREAVTMLRDTTLADAKSSRDMAMSGELAAKKSRIIGKDRAVESAANINTGGAAAAPAEGAISISRGPSAPASVRVTAPTSPTAYTKSATAAMANPGWSGTHLERSVSGATQHLFVYTDIELPTRAEFYDWDRDGSSLYADTGVLVHQNPYSAVDEPLTPLILDEGARVLLSGLDPKFGKPGPAKDGDVTTRFRVDSSTATTTTFKGSFNGASGTYICTTAAGVDCTVRISPTGTYTEVNGTWTFTPELNAEGWRQDGEFMRFGWWLQEPNSPDGAYAFGYYAAGNLYTTPPGGITTGTATYSGRAAGKYVVQEIDDSGVTGGVAHQFTAAAKLDAIFEAVANSISGTISDFTADDGSSPDWEVTLHEKTLDGESMLPNPFPSATETDPARPSFNGVTATMEDQMAYGDWTGQYFGDANTGNTVNAYPLGVGGTFHADNEKVSIAGAFGARRPKSE